MNKILQVNINSLFQQKSQYKFSRVVNAHFKETTSTIQFVDNKNLAIIFRELLEESRQTLIFSTFIVYFSLGYLFCIAIYFSIVFEIIITEVQLYNLSQRISFSLNCFQIISVFIFICRDHYPKLQKIKYNYCMGTKLAESQHKAFNLCSDKIFYLNIF